MPVARRPDKFRILRSQLMCEAIQLTCLNDIIEFNISLLSIFITVTQSLLLQYNYIIELTNSVHYIR